jgi:large subunit ribosomal protein L16
MFIPKKTKFKKQQKGKAFNKIKSTDLCLQKNTNKITLKAISSGRLSSKHLLASRQTINKIIKKHGILNVCIFAHTPITKKPTEIRMGKGKGAVNLWISKIKTGTTLFEINVSIKMLAIKALKLVQNKLPIKTRIL